MTGRQGLHTLYDLPMLTERSEVLKLCYTVLTVLHVIYTYISDGIKCHFSEDPNCRTVRSICPGKQNGALQQCDGCPLVWAWLQEQENGTDLNPALKRHSE